MKKVDDAVPLTAGKRGFSLVELSIVLVILGLLTGGILTGRNLIRASELKGVVSEFHVYQTAIMTFQDEYGALPGDLPNATNYWGVDPDGCPEHTNYTPKRETCDGDGDGRISVFDNINSMNTDFPERFRAWQHLANAGLIEGAYTGVSGPGSNRRAIPGENTPLSRMGKAGWGLSNYNCCVGNNENFYFDYGNHLLFGADDGSLSNGAPVLTPKEAWVIDGKVDDGLAVSGRVISNVECTDAPNNNVTSANYLLGNTGILCHLKFTGVF
jgi:prepilin-type N-terminal cleavage/methylation domain-containing protein